MNDLVLAVKLGELQEALDSFEKALDMAKLQSDSAAEAAIKKAIEDVNHRIVTGIREKDDKTSGGYTSFFLSHNDVNVFRVF
jgi:hypothetical protein